MKSNVIRALAMLFIVALMTGCSNADFVGNSYKVGNTITIEYGILNMTATEKINLKAGDTVDFDILSEAGDVDIDFGIKDKAPVYEGNSVDTGSFTVTVHEDGRYILSVTGVDAKGSVKLTKGEQE